MALDAYEIIDAGEEIRRLVRDVKVGIRLGVRGYREHMAAGREVDAIRSMKFGMNHPHLTKARLGALITAHTQPVVTECVASAFPSGITLSGINTRLTELINAMIVLRDHKINDGWTWDQVATWIEGNIENPKAKTGLPIPAGYVDIFGE